MSMDAGVDEQPINQKLTFDDEPEQAPKALQLNQAPALPKKKTPTKRSSTGAPRKSPSKTPKLKDFFPLLSSSSSESSLPTEAANQTIQTTTDIAAVAQPEPPAIFVSSSDDCLNEKTNSNEAPLDAFATPKGVVDVQPTATTFEGIFSTPCHRPPPGVTFDLAPSVCKTPIVSSLRKNRTAEGAHNSSVKKSVQFSRVNVFLFERKQGKKACQFATFS